jgi:hypothetical protein
MKTIGIILLLALLVAFITLPNREKFNTYLNKTGKEIGKCSGPGSIRHYSYRVFTIDYIDYCDPVINKEKTEMFPGTGLTHTDRYLGIFGMFFKI